MRRQLRVTADVRSLRTRVAARALIKQGHNVLLTHGVLRTGKCTCGDDNCGKVGKHPLSEFFPKGVNSATRDLFLIDGALKKYPHANLAMALGGLTVVDIDGPKGRDAVKKSSYPRALAYLPGGENIIGSVVNIQVELSRVIRSTFLVDRPGMSWCHQADMQVVNNTVGFNMGLFEPQLCRALSKACGKENPEKALRRGRFRRVVNRSAKALGMINCFDWRHPFDIEGMITKRSGAWLALRICWNARNRFLITNWTSYWQAAVATNIRKRNSLRS